ncbi:MAG: ComEC/Rec2-related protein [Limisphaerales bacterium]|nr:MAG: ComEC/Rec2-related protein [Limisphaerales bacterium]KAG0509864.1 MAG: ComEC/Rec2-related protein [Limisphaerales bacterium]TXT50914.1 MAG: ComEC/Rec2-related protein [Limisphaerales bacterium]
MRLLPSCSLHCLNDEGHQPAGPPASAAPLNASVAFSRRHPLVPVALAYGLGVLCGWKFPLPLAGLFMVAGALTVAALGLPRRRGWLLWPLLVSLGWTNMGLRSGALSPVDLRVVAKGAPELVTLRARLTETPTLRVFEREERESWRSHAVVEVESLGRRGEWQPATGLVAVTTPGVLGANFFAGRTVELTGILRAPRGALAPGLFDYRAFLRWQGIWFQLQCADPNDWRLAADSFQPGRPPLADRFLVWSQRILARGLPVEDEELRLLWAMTLGWKTALTDEVAEPFMRSGTMHVFAISGLHIALIAGILLAVLRAVQLPRGACGVVIVPLIWCYTAATGWQPSAIRSTIMMTVIIGGWALRRPGNLLNSLAASGFIILLWQPTQLFQASFQLSFFVVLAIALLLPPFENFRQRLLQTDPLLPDELRPRWQRWLDWPVRFLTVNFATSLAAWLGSLPLIAHYFHLLTPASLLANLVVVPLSGLALMCNLGALVTGDWLPWITDAFNHAGWLFMHWMTGFSQWTTTLPLAYVHVRAPTGFEFFAFYTTVFLLVAGWFWTDGKRRRAWGILLSLSAIWLAGELRTRDDARLTVLGHGANAVFCDAPGRSRDLLVDCGGESAADFLVKPFLRAQGVGTLPHLALTHGDLRRVGGFRVMTREFQPALTFTSPARARSPAYREALRQLEADPARWKTISSGDQAAGWHVLHPAATDKFDRADDSALVLRAEFHGLRVLLLSELGAPGQRALLTRGGDLQADLVVAGLPEQGEPLGDDLLAVIRPRLIVLADAEYPAAKRAKPALLARLSRTGATVLKLTETGTLTLRCHAGSCAVLTVDGRQLRVLAR